MFLGAYRFAGEPADLLSAYDRLIAGFPPDAIALHVCVAGENGITIFDTCPSRAVFAQFSTSTAFASAIAAAGLPAPTVEPLGDVHNAIVRPTAP
jgi:hypothetical protein